MNDTLPSTPSTAAPSAASAIPRPASPRARRDARRPLVESGNPRAFGPALHAFARVRVWQWHRALRDVRKAQLAQLRAIVRRAAHTEFGRRQGLGGVSDHAGFANHIPLSDYDGHLPWFERMRAGASNVLVPGFVLNWGKSSGSSNQRREKILPIDEVQVRHQQQAGADVLCAYLVGADDRTFPQGFTMSVFPSILQSDEGAYRMSSNPALMASRLPRLSRAMTLPEQDILVLKDLDDKLQRIAGRYRDHDVRAVMGTTCWFSVLFERVLEAAGHPAGGVAEIWPNLRVLFGGGVPADPYRPLIRRMVGRDVTLIDTYNATEGGILGATDYSRGDASGLTVVPHRGVFFEFIPVEDLGKTSPRRVPLWEVRRGVVYSIAVTTTSGLYAYQLGDFVRFTSLAPPMMEFAGRASGCLSLTQELMTQLEIEDAVAHAAATVPSILVDYGAGAEVGVDGSARSRYLLFAEFAAGHAPVDATAFAHAFDESLRAQNRAYREHRANDVAILAPQIVPLPYGTARRFLEKVTLGNLQGKFPRILDDDKIALLRSLVVVH